MPRRHGWLQDYHQELDYGPDRSIPASPSNPQSQVPPVNINININLGDLITQLVKGQKTTREALEEIVQEGEEQRRLLVEGSWVEDDED